MVVIEAHACHRAGDDTAAMIAALTRDDPVLRRLAAQVVVVLDELGLSRVGVRSGHGMTTLLILHGANFTRRSDRIASSSVV